MSLESVRASVAGGESIANAIGAAGGLTAAGMIAARDAAAASFHGAGDLQSMLAEPGVTDLVVHGGEVWVDRGAGMERTGMSLGEEREVRGLAVRLAALAGQRLDDAAPIVDGVLPSGARLHAVLPPLAADGTSISLRTHNQALLSFDELCRTGAIGPLAAAALAGLVKRRANGVIAGATGTGKTTLLSALMAVVPADERLVCIEEVRELEPAHPHVAHLQARAANVQQAGAVGLDALVRAALRMRPDRIVLGEARGSEIREVLSAMNTGHAGSWFTLHANSAADVPARIVALGGLAGLAPAVVVMQARVALDVVVMLRRDAGIRHVASLAVLLPGGEDLLAQPVLEVRDGVEVPLGDAWDRFTAKWMK